MARLQFLKLLQFALATVVAFRVLSGACLAHSDGLQEPLAWTADVTPSDARRDVCATLTDGVRVRIEKLKTLSNDWAAKLRTGQGNDTSDKMRDERRTIKDLNAMLQGIGCKSLDVEYELAQPPRTIPSAPAAKLKIGKHHRSS